MLIMRWTLFLFVLALPLCVGCGPDKSTAEVKTTDQPISSYTADEEAVMNKPPSQ